MNQNVIVEVQKLSGGITAGSVAWAWFGQNATALTALMTIITGTIFAGCAIWNGYTNHQKGRLEKHAIIRGAIKDIDELGLNEESRKVIINKLKKQHKID